MRKFTLMAVTLLWASIILGQNIQITFSGSGEATTVDSVIVRNMSSNEQITLPGDEILTLDATSGLGNLKESSTGLQLFPNPFQCKSTLMIDLKRADNVIITVQDLTGHNCFQAEEYLDRGNHVFDLSLNQSGIYLISFKTKNEQRSTKAICMESGNGSILLSRKSTNLPSSPGGAPSRFKGFTNEYNLPYSFGDVLHYTCKSGKYTSIITDSPESSQNYEVKFIDCTDAQSRSYGVVTLGEQVWMAENLAYLPVVHPPGSMSDTLGRYYVYGYTGSNIDEAQANENYQEFGVLYNWEAAIESCPTGWHLPTKDEWWNLTIYLERNGYGFSEYDYMIAKSLASNAGWRLSYEAGRIGRYQSTNNRSGLCMKPGGYLYRMMGDDFIAKGERSSYWSSTEYGANAANTIGITYESRSVYWGTPAVTHAFSVRCLKD